MPNVSFTVAADRADIDAGPSRNVRVELSGVDLREIIDAVGEGDILDEIGEQAAIDYFDIEVA